MKYKGKNISRKRYLELVASKKSRDEFLNNAGLVLSPKTYQKLLEASK